MPPKKKARVTEPETVPKKRKVIDIDPEGDMVVFAGKGDFARLMRVKKETLTRASPVFSTMLNGRFAEGQKDHTADDPLQLPGDDAAAMETMFKLLHLTLKDAAETRECHIHLLVALCDKYAVLDAQTLPLQAILDRWRESEHRVLVPKLSDMWEPTLASTLEGLYIAYLLNDSANFGHLSHEIFKYASPWCLERVYSSDALGHLMPDDFGAKMAVALRGALRRAMDCYYEPLKALQYVERDDLKLRKYNNMCDEGERRTMHYMKTLFEDPDFLPPGTIQEGTRFNEMTPFKHWPGKKFRISQGRLRDRSEFIRQEGSQPPPPFKIGDQRQCIEDKCLCQQPLEDLVYQLRQESMEALGQCCLKCFKEGKPEVTVSACRIHPYWCQKLRRMGLQVQ